MKKFILSMTMLVLVLCLKANVSNAAEISAMERLDYWDVSKEYTITNQDATAPSQKSPLHLKHLLSDTMQKTAKTSTPKSFSFS